MTDYTEEFKNWIDGLFHNYLESLKVTNLEEFNKYYRDKVFNFYRTDEMKALNISNEYAFIISTAAGGFKQMIVDIGHKYLRKELRIDCAIFGKDRSLVFKIIEVFKNEVLENGLYPFADISIVKFTGYDERAEEVHNVIIPILTFECTAFFTE